MNLFNDMLLADAIGVFSDAAGGFAEPVVYRKRDGREFPFSAIVWRETAQPVSEAPPSGRQQNFTPSLKVFVPNDPANAAGVGAVDAQADKIFLPTEQGGRPEKHHIACILSQDAGGWMLQLV